MVALRTALQTTRPGSRQPIPVTNLAVVVDCCNVNYLPIADCCLSRFVACCDFHKKSCLHVAVNERFFRWKLNLVRYQKCSHFDQIFFLQSEAFKKINTKQRLKLFVKRIFPASK